MGALDRRDVLSSFALALGASLYLFLLTSIYDTSRFYVAGQVIMSQDQVGYLTSARWLVDTGELRNYVIFPSTVREPNWRLYMPGQYYLLAAAHVLIGDGPLAWRVPALLAFVLSTVGVFLIGRRFHDHDAALIAAVSFAAFSPITAFAFTAMPQVPFIAATVVAFCTFAYLPETARPWAVPVLLALPFLFRETGAFVIVPMLLVTMPILDWRHVKRAALTTIASVAFLIGLLSWQLAEGKTSLPLDGSRFNYANAFPPPAPPLDASRWFDAMAANVSRNAAILTRHAERLDFVFVPLVILIVVAVVAFFRGVRGDRLALGASLLFAVAVLVMTVFYTWERYRGLRAVLFTVPFLMIGVAPSLARLARAPRLVVLIAIVALGYWGNRPMARGQDRDDGARAVEALERLALDDGGVLIAPTPLAIDYALRHYPVRWSFPPANPETLALVASVHDVRSVIVREDELDDRFSEEDLRAIGLVRTRAFEHRVFTVPATFVVFERR